MHHGQEGCPIVLPYRALCIMAEEGCPIGPYAFDVPPNAECYRPPRDQKRRKNTKITEKYIFFIDLSKNRVVVDSNLNFS